MDKKSRIQGAIWGQVIGDGITLGTHWIYDPEKMRQEFPEIKGFETPKAGHYHAGKVSGDSTHYGEGCRLMLQSIAECKKFDVVDFSKRFRAFFGSPFYKGYLDHATRGALQNMERNISPSGADDDQMATAGRLAPLVSFYLDSRELEQKVLEATLVSQNNPKAIAYMKCNARILADLLRGHGLRESFERQLDDPRAGESIRAALELKGLSVFEATKKLGLSCHLDEAFPSAIYIAILCEGSFEKALLANTQAGGDSAGRGGMLGAWLGALQGMEGIPSSWLLQIRGKEHIAYWIEVLLNTARA